MITMLAHLPVVFGGRRRNKGLELALAHHMRKVGQVGKEDPVLFLLMPEEEEGEEDGDDNEDSGGDVGRFGPSSEELLRSGILCDPDLQRPEMRLALTQVKHAQCSSQTQRNQHVGESPVPVKRHPLRILALVYLTKSEVAKD